MQIPFEVDSPQKDEISKKEAPISNPSIPVSYTHLTLPTKA